MRMREFLTRQAGEFGFLWKSQVLVGFLLIVVGIAILIFPAILIGLVAAGLILAGVSLVSGAWRLRRLWRHSKGASDIDPFVW